MSTRRDCLPLVFFLGSTWRAANQEALIEMVDSTGRVAKSTLILYIRQLILLAVNLYAVRVTLHALGVTDYGLYNVVAGLVSLGTFLSAGMASSTQRYFAVSLSRGESETLRKVFGANLVIYVVMAVIAVGLLETIGKIFVEDALRVASGRREAVLTIYQFAIGSFIASLCSTLYVAVLIAHENMKAYAYVSLAEAILKLLVAVAITHVDGDKLVYYAALLAAVSILTLIIYSVLCGRIYPECRYSHFEWDRALFTNIIGFTGWSLFGQLSTVIRTQAITVLLNQAFGPGVVAARVIAVNVATQVNQFATNFNTGLYPAIVKAHAAGDRPTVQTLLFGGSKATFILTWVLSLPMLLEMDVILEIWLGKVPDSAVLFARLAIIEAIIMVVGIPVGTLARAVGNMRRYELILGSLQLSIFVLSWLLLEFNFQAQSVFWVAIFVNLLMFIARMQIVKSDVPLSVGLYLRQAVVPMISVAFLSASLGMIVKIQLGVQTFSSLVVCASSSLSCLIAMWFLGLSSQERLGLRRLLQAKLIRRKV